MKKILFALLVLAPFSMANAAEHGGKAVKDKAPAAKAAEDAGDAAKKKAAEAMEALKKKNQEHGGKPVKK